MYFFTPRHPTSASSQRARRTAGCGVWLGCGKDEHIKFGSQLIGHKTQLTFVIFKGKDKKEKINTGWIMHEFRSHSPPSSSSNKAKFDDLVLCRIHLKKNSNSNNKCQEEQAYAGSVAYSGVVSFTQQQEEEEAEGRLVKRRRLEEDGLMAVSNAETGTSGISIYTNQSAAQPAAAPLSSSSPNMPLMVPLEELRELSSMASDAVSDADSGAISIAQQQQKEDADADLDYALSLELQLEEDVEDVEEEEAVGRWLVKRRRLEENGSMADSNCEINIYTELSSHPALFLPASLPNIPPMVLLDGPRELTSKASDVASVDSAVAEQEAAAETEERLLQRKRVEEPELQQGLMADNSEPQGLAPNASDVPYLAAAVADLFDPDFDPMASLRRFGDLDESTSHLLSFDADIDPPASLQCHDDLGTLPPVDAEFNMLSSFVAPLRAANHIPDHHYTDGFSCLPSGRQEVQEKEASNQFYPIPRLSFQDVLNYLINSEEQ